MAKKPLVFKDVIMQSGTLVRHLILPQNASDSVEVLNALAPLKNDIYFSLMSQYTPFGEIDNYPELKRKITKREYDRVLNHAINLGFENMFVQDLTSSTTDYIPTWDY